MNFLWPICLKPITCASTWSMHAPSYIEPQPSPHTIQSLMITHGMQWSHIHTHTHIVTCNTGYRRKLRATALAGSADLRASGLSSAGKSGGEARAEPSQPQACSTRCIDASALSDFPKSVLSRRHSVLPYSWSFSVRNTENPYYLAALQRGVSLWKLRWNPSSNVHNFDV